MLPTVSPITTPKKMQVKRPSGDNRDSAAAMAADVDDRASIAKTNNLSPADVDTSTDTTSAGSAVTIICNGIMEITSCTADTPKQD